MPNKGVTVFLIEDDESLAYALRRRLEAAGLSVETFATAEDFLEACDPQRPGCAVVDLMLPGLDGLELQKRLAATGCTLPIIFVSGVGTIPAAVEAVKGGAVDFLTKPVDEKLLLERVRKALASYEAQHMDRQQRRELEARFRQLTARERELLDLVVSGHTNKEIASKLGISPKTVEAHRAKVMLKTGAENIVELVRMADAMKAPAP